MCVTECYQDGVCVCAHVCVCVGLGVCFCARLQSNSIASYLQGKMTWMHPSHGCEPFPPSLPPCLPVEQRRRRLSNESISSSPSSFSRANAFLLMLRFRKNIKRKPHENIFIRHVWIAHPVHSRNERTHKSTKQRFRSLPGSGFCGQFFPRAPAVLQTVHRVALCSRRLGTRRAPAV